MSSFRAEKTKPICGDTKKTDGAGPENEGGSRAGQLQRCGGLRQEREDFGYYPVDCFIGQGPEKKQMEL